MAHSSAWVFGTSMTWEWEPADDEDVSWESAGGEEVGCVSKFVSEGGEDNGESEGEPGIGGKRKGGLGGSGIQSIWSWNLVMLIGAMILYP